MFFSSRGLLALTLGWLAVNSFAERGEEAEEAQPEPLPETPQFTYANFKKVGMAVKGSSKKIGEVIDKMTPDIPNMLRKSLDYQHNNFILQDTIDKLAKDTIPTFTKGVTKEKEKEVAAIKNVNYDQAFTAHDRKVINEASQADLRLIKNGEFSKLPDMANLEGTNPYEDMSLQHWNDQLDVTDVQSKDDVQDDMPPEVNGIVVHVPPKSGTGQKGALSIQESSLVEVHPLSFTLEKNMSHTGE